jgi:hypothetical protein
MKLSRNWNLSTNFNKKDWPVKNFLASFNLFSDKVHNTQQSRDHFDSTENFRNRHIGSEKSPDINLYQTLPTGGSPKRSELFNEKRNIRKGRKNPIFISVKTPWDKV